jgi:hypothetical protein
VLNWSATLSIVVDAIFVIVNNGYGAVIKTDVPFNVGFVTIALSWFTE